MIFREDLLQKMSRNAIKIPDPEKFSEDVGKNIIFVLFLFYVMNNKSPESLDYYKYGRRHKSSIDLIENKHNINIRKEFHFIII